MSYQRFYRSTTSRVIGGVAGGIAEFFNMDPIIIRIIFVLAALFGGGGVLIYLVLWIAVPERPYTTTMFNSGTPPESDQTSEMPPKTEPVQDADLTTRRKTGSLVGGIILISIGALVLVTRAIPDLFFYDLWPFILVAAGIALIVYSMNKSGKQ